MVLDTSFDKSLGSKLSGLRKDSQLETRQVPTNSKVKSIQPPLPRPRFMDTQSDPTLTSPGSPIRKAIPQSQRLAASSTRDKCSSQPSRIVSDSIGRPKQIINDAARIPQDCIPRKRARLDGSEGPEVDGLSTSEVRYSPSPSHAEATQQPHQEHDGFSQVLTPKTARSTHDSLYGELLKKLTPSDRKGVIYVLCDPNNKSRGYKIGKTKRAYRDRIVEHERACSFLPSVIHVSDHEIDHCGRLEKLVHIDLENYCAPFHCENHGSIDGTKETKAHKEWFQVTEEMAVNTVKKWERFMQQEKPYSWDRQLKIIWRHLLETRRSLGPLGVRTLTHEARQEHWEKILAPPTTTEYLHAYRAHIQMSLKSLCHSAVYVWTYVSEFFWPLCTLIYGVITLAVFQNLLAFYAFVFILGCASARVLSYVPLSPPKRRTRTPNKVHTAVALLQH
ncbi:T5orf172 domain-containing protein [Alternaria rosae]|uniref:T5orf172 domain-containing protein n=1 Tax=Alternaria rosae TaxID=1187941 RepID=UPI001E8CF960|nr:T5orf172 domain-containing protein [Alternaria rosae]KAH6872476.1 T5orf172 domain-containing protein [Alternaria rosae]